MKNESFFFIRSNRKYERIDISQLVYIESCRGYVKLFMTTKVSMVHVTMLALENVLPAGLFVRIHRSYILAIGRVTSFDKEQVTIIGTDGQKINLPVGQDRYKTALMQKIIAIGETVEKDKIVEVL
jgi:two-component system response regulator LytT